MSSKYPWYGRAKATDKPEQGDLLVDVPIVTAREVLPIAGRDFTPVLKTYDGIVLSQSCDLVRSGKLNQVIIAPVAGLNVFLEKNGHLNTVDRLNDLRKNNIPRYYLMNNNRSNAYTRGFLVADFGNVQSITFKTLQAICASQPKRLRLLTPYREQLAQHFARFYMRVGLPDDIPEFIQPRNL